MIIAYLINQYPQPSHTFIRREIAGVEAAGATVLRFTLRRFGGTLVDPADVAERDRTRAVLDAGPAGILFGVLRELLTRPRRFFRAIMLLQQFNRASTRGLFAHLAYLAEACVLRQWLSEAGATHVHAHFGTNSTTVASLCHELGGPAYSFTVHGPEEFDQPAGLSLGLKVHLAAFAVGISSFGRSQLCRWSDPSDWAKIHVIRCGVDQSFLQEQPTQIPVENSFVCVGRLEPQKGQLLLLDAVETLVAEGVAIKLTLIGGGSLRPVIESKINTLGLQAVIHLSGWQPGSEIRNAISKSRALVLPSFAEGLPVVLMESLALNRPVIATWVAGIPELVDPENGWLVPAGDVAALAGALRNAISASPSQLQAMGSSGRRKILQVHDSSTEALKLFELISSL